MNKLAKTKFLASLIAPTTKLPRKRKPRAIPSDPKIICPHCHKHITQDLKKFYGNEIIRLATNIRRHIRTLQKQLQASLTSTPN